MTWRPTASIDTLIKRADLLEQIRIFFRVRKVLEVETPLLSPAAVTDVHLESFVTTQYPAFNFPPLYLQTSPEYAMKRLLAAGSGSIFQICKAFRCEPKGQLHNPEFTMLEWYREGFNHYNLMDEVDEFLQVILKAEKAKRYTYQAIFEKHLAINPHQASLERLQYCIEQQKISVVGELNKDDCLNVLMTHVIEPTLQAPTFIYDYPASQAALARIKGGVAERFELYYKGIELANGFHELSNAKEQEKRFSDDLEKRKARGQVQPVIDRELLKALSSGLPDCAGVALGVDRLLMLLLDVKNIKDVLSFYCLV